MRAIQMMALAFLASVAPASLAAQITDYDADEKTMDRAEAACKADAESAECTGLKDKVAEIVSRHLFTLALTRDGAKHMQSVVPFATARHPKIRHAAAAAMGGLIPIDEDTPVLARLLNDPVPAVRSAAKAALGESIDPAANLLTKRAGETNSDDFTAQTPPDPASLGAPLYDGAAYNFFSSVPKDGLVSYVTTDSSDSVVNFYKDKGEVLTLAEFDESYAGREELNTTAGVMKMQQLIAQRIMQQQRSGATLDPRALMAPPLEVSAERYGDDNVYGNLRVVVLEGDEFDDLKVARRLVVIFEERLFGGAGMEFLGMPSLPGAAAMPAGALAPPGQMPQMPTAAQMPTEADIEALKLRMQQMREKNATQ